MERTILGCITHHRRIIANKSEPPKKVIGNQSDSESNDGGADKPSEKQEKSTKSKQNSDHSGSSGSTGSGSGSGSGSSSAPDSNSSAHDTETTNASQIAKPQEKAVQRMSPKVAEQQMKQHSLKEEVPPEEPVKVPASETQETIEMQMNENREIGALISTFEPLPSTFKAQPMQSNASENALECIDGIEIVEPLNENENQMDLEQPKESDRVQASHSIEFHTERTELDDELDDEPKVEAKPHKRIISMDDDDSDDEDTEPTMANADAVDDGNQLTVNTTNVPPPFDTVSRADVTDEEEPLSPVSKMPRSLYFEPGDNTKTTDVALEPETVIKNRNDEKVEDQNGQSNEEKQISETKTDESLSRERNDSIVEPMDTSDTAPVESEIDLQNIDSDDITAKPHERDENINQSESHSSNNSGSGSMSVKKFWCDHCGEGFTLTRNIKKHFTYARCPVLTNKKKQEKKYWCDRCGRGFTLVQNMKRHLTDATCPVLKDKKKQENKCTCEHCAKIYSNPQNLKRHLKDLH